ncbi:MAG: hypothetical protein ACOCXJ_09610 [Planctomycetota bacterium]
MNDVLREQTFHEIRRWVHEGRLSEAELDQCVLPVLRMKAEQGLFSDGGCVDAAAAQACFADPAIADVGRQVAQLAVTTLWDPAGLLPLRGRVLCIEQLIIPEFMPENQHYHSFAEALFRHSHDMLNMDCAFQATDEEVRMACGLAETVDTVLMTNWYWRIQPENNGHLIAALCAAGKRVVVVTNNPYPMGADPAADAVVCTYGVVPHCLQAAAAVLHGAAPSRGRWPLEHTPAPTPEPA